MWQKLLLHSYKRLGTSSVPSSVTTATGKVGQQQSCFCRSLLALVPFFPYLSNIPTSTYDNTQQGLHERCARNQFRHNRNHAIHRSKHDPARKRRLKASVAVHDMLYIPFHSSHLPFFCSHHSHTFHPHHNRYISTHSCQPFV
jgi:hypothetical protein